MANNMIHYNDKNKLEVRSPSRSAATVSLEKPVPMTVKGQRYVAPAGRHSQQKHRLAAERAAANGHASEKEQHDHDRDLVTTEINRRSQTQVSRQRLQSEQTAAKKAQSAAAPPASKQD